MGKRMHQLIHKNEGSALILVLLCMTFLGLLGSVVLTATVSNMKMKTVDAKSKDNFYTAESAIDELKVGLEEEAQNRMKEAYSYMLQRYSTTPDSERTTLLMRKFVSLLYDELAFYNSEATQPYETSSIDMDLKAFLLSPTGQQATIINPGGITVIKDLNDLSVTLKQVSIRYTDASGYESTITTDIKINATYPSLSTRAVNNAGIYYRDYALIADGIIQKDGSSVTTVNGNIYGGAGISAIKDGSVLKLNSQKVISRESLQAMDKAQIIIPEQRKDSVLTNSVWVKNMTTTQSDPDVGSLSDYINITANCYVKDDLNLNAKYGKVTIAGNYYGYQISNANDTYPSGTALGSSSVSINARNAVLDFQGVSNLWISGKAYLSIPRVYGGGSSDSTTEVLAGESISFKGDQVAYLVPGNCIVGIGHNPMTVAEFLKLGTSEDYKVDITLNKEYDGIILENYVNSEEIESFTPHRIRYLHDDGSMEMVYLYLKFKSADAASDYFHEYQQLNLDKLRTIAKSLELGSVLLPDTPETLVHTGTILEYDSNDEDSLTYTNRRKLTPTYDVTIASSTEEIRTKQSEYEMRYKGLINYLNEKYHATGDSLSLVSNLIRYEDDTTNHIPGISTVSQAMYADPAKNTYDIYEEAGSDTYILVTGRPGTVTLDYDQNGKSGLVIAKGNVVVNGCEFNGLIITTGEIHLEAGANVNAAPEYVKNIIDTRPEVSRFFYDYIPNGTGSSGDTNTIQITYDNWYKE